MPFKWPLSYSPDVLTSITLYCLPNFFSQNHPRSGFYWSALRVCNSAPGNQNIPIKTILVWFWHDYQMFCSIFVSVWAGTTRLFPISLPVFKYHQRRHAHHTICIRRLRVLIHIHFTIVALSPIICFSSDRNQASSCQDRTILPKNQPAPVCPYLSVR